MAHLDLRISEGCDEPYIEFHVDGMDLGAQVCRAMGPDGFDDVMPWYGGDYRLSDTVLGEEVRERGGKNVVLFACGCGHHACGGVSVDVQVTEATISLSRFSTWRQGREVVAPLDAVVFDRQQFNDAVLNLQSEVERWQPPRQEAIPPPPPRTVFAVDGSGVATIAGDPTPELPESDRP